MLLVRMRRGDGARCNVTVREFTSVNALPTRLVELPEAFPRTIAWLCR